jgi:uncharacterized protein YabN with tetrapyrrole methylase and pyrophosphatase domain
MSTTFQERGQHVESDNTIDFAIALIGMGVQDVTHMTLEAVAVLQRCKRGFVAGADQKAVDHFSGALASYLKPSDFLPDLVSLSRAYRHDRKRRENYREAANIVLEATGAERPIAYLTPGNPIAYDAVAHEILMGARTRSIPVVVIAGISSVDTVLVDLQREPAPGLQVFEASCFVGAAVKPDTRFACLLMQVGVFGTNYAVLGREPQMNALALLMDYLLQFYPRDHSAVLVRSATDSCRPANVHRFTIGSLGQVPADALQGASLYIPALSAPQLGQRFRERMESLDNLNATYPKSPH